MDNRWTYERNIGELRINEIDIQKFGVLIGDLESRDYNDIRSIKWNYYIPEESLLSDSNAIYRNKYDMRDKNVMVEYIKNIIRSFYKGYVTVKLDNIISKSGTKITKKQKSDAIINETTRILKHIRFNCWIRTGLIWTDEDYNKIVDQIDSRVIELDVTNMSDEEIEQLRRSVEGNAEDRIIIYKSDYPMY